MDDLEARWEAEFHRERTEGDHLASEAEADREYARFVGFSNPERAWVLSDRDVWYANPAYAGPPQPHPEDDHACEAYYADPEAWVAEELAAREARSRPLAPPPDSTDEIPF